VSKNARERADVELCVDPETQPLGGLLPQFFDCYNKTASSETGSRRAIETRLSANVWARNALAAAREFMKESSVRHREWGRHDISDACEDYAWL